MKCLLLLILMLIQYKYYGSIIVNSAIPGIKLRPISGREDHSVYPEHRSIIGGRAELPCNITFSSGEDSITLILWYRGENRTPIYSVDARSMPLTTAKHSPLQDVFGANNRAVFDLSTRPALLKIDPVKEDDGMEYRCRVDFRWGRTMSTLVTLNVIVPPRKLIIKDERGMPLNDIIGPYNEGSDLRLWCEAYGGKPPPALHWYHETILIDDSYTISEDNSSIRNILLISNLTRNQLNAQYTCQAMNPNFSTPIFTSVTIDINLKPLDIHITSIERPLLSGRNVEISCETRGSRPHAQIIWLHNNRPLTNPSVRSSLEGNATISSLHYTPSANDHGAYLSCRAENLRLANSSIETGLTLNVHYSPKVSLLMGTNTKSLSISSLLSSHIIEGDEIFMKCQINSNPHTDVIQFVYNGVPLITNSKGVFINNSTLVIKSARKEHKGRYQCVTANSIGKGESNDLILDVRYAPICKSHKRVFGAAIGEKVNITCMVEAEPSDVAFQWTVNNNELLGSFVSNGRESTLTFTPRTKRDFGVVACRAKNSVGVQKDPCIYSIVSAGLPSPVSGCLVSNQTSSSMLIDCISGDDGGLQQYFHLELYDLTRSKLIANISQSERAEFALTDLASGTKFHAVIYSSNSKGKSATMELTVPTLALLNKKFVAEIPESEDISSLLAIFISVIGTLIVMIIIAVIICRIKRQREGSKSSRRSLNVNSTLFIHTKDADHSDTTIDDLHCSAGVSSNDASKNPDVIPPGNGFLGFANGDIISVDDERYQQNDMRMVNCISSNHVYLSSTVRREHNSPSNEHEHKITGIYPGSDQFTCINMSPDRFVNYIKATIEEPKVSQRQRVFPLSTPV